MGTNQATTIGQRAEFRKNQKLQMARAVARFPAALKKGRNIRHLALRQRQTEVAMGNGPGSTAILIFLGKNELGQSDTGANDKPAAPVSLTLEAWDALVDEYRRKKKEGIS
jgi:hypothetical protein